MKCNNCGADGNNKTLIHQGKLLSGCDKCLTNLAQGDSAAFERRAQKVNYRRDLIQPNDKEFGRAYPDLAREQWGDDLARKYA